MTKDEPLSLDGKALLDAGVTGFQLNGKWLLSQGFGNKEVIFVEREQGLWIATCTCDALNCGLAVHMKQEQVLELLLGSRRAIQEVLPQTAPELREIFVSGITPAEFDQRLKGKFRSKAEYIKLGYDAGCSVPRPRNRNVQKPTL